MKCPFPNCERQFDSFISLKAHVSKSHRNERKCPVCGVEKKNLVQHLRVMAKKCEEHARFYVLVRKSSRNYGNNEFYREMVELYFGEVNSV